MTPETLLHRQVFPAHIHNGEITSQVFKPMRRNSNRLSVYDGDLISAEESWKHYVNVLHNQSKGVVAVTVQECTDIQLHAQADPTDFAEHAVIDFNELSRKEVERKSDSLKQRALERGWLYQPPQDSANQ